MSATPNNIGAGWSAAPVVPSPSHEAGGAKENALQALLAFACIHEQAEQRRRAASPAIPESTRPSLRKEEEFALDEILQLVAGRARSITGADGVAVALADESAIVCRATSGKTVPDVGMRVDPKSGFSGACLRRGETVRCDDSETDSRVNAEACRRLGTRSMVAVPLATRHRIIGLVEAFSNESYGFNDSDVRSLSLLAELILAALRPEEEDRLADLAAKVLPIAAGERAVESKAPAESTFVPAPAATNSTLAAPASAPKVDNEALELPKPAAKVIEPARVLVDEKFFPAVSVQPERKAVVSSLPEAVPVEAKDASKTLSEMPTASPAAVPMPQPVRLPAKETLPHRWPVSMLVTAASVLVALALLGLIVWKAQHLGQAISANTHAAAEVKAVESQAPEIATPAPPLKPGATPELTAIQHTSSADSSTVIIDVQDQVQYEAHSLDNPPRIYFDLHDTKLSAALANQSIAVNDAFVKRIRVAQGADDVTRVVLETQGQPEFSVSLDSNPYRLTIQLHKAATAPASTQPAVPAKPSPAINLLPKKSSSKPSAAAAGPFSIVLDAGHGGWDLGTVGRKGLLEKDLVLDIVLRLGKLLEDRLGAEVIYTRQDDSYLPLEKRAEIANLAKADLFLSVHANYSDLPTARGVETYFSRTYSSEKARSESAPQLQQVNWSSVVDIRAKVMDSRRFAADVQQALFNGVAGRNPEIKNRGVKEAQYVVLTGTQMPAVLAEVSFVSSPADEDKLQNSEYRQGIAEALYRGIVQYRKDAKVALAKK